MLSIHRLNRVKFVQYCRAVRLVDAQYCRIWIAASTAYLPLCKQSFEESVGLVISSRCCQTTPRTEINAASKRKYLASLETDWWESVSAELYIGSQLLLGKDSAWKAFSHSDTKSEADSILQHGEKIILSRATLVYRDSGEADTHHTCANSSVPNSRAWSCDDCSRETSTAFRSMGRVSTTMHPRRIVFRWSS